MHVGQQRRAVWKRSLFKFNRNKQNRSVKGGREHPGSLAETNSPPGPGLHSGSLSPPVRSSLKTVFFFFFASLLQLTSWLGSRPLPLLQLETNHIYVKTTSELFPSPARPEYKTCSEWLPHSLEEFYDFVTAAQRVRLLGRGSLESLPNNEATLLLAFPFNSNKTAHVSIFRWLSSGAIDMQKPEPQARTGPAGLSS